MRDLTAVVPGLQYKAVFVPLSASRHAGKWVSINWRVTFSLGNNSVTTDYAQGVGHLPGYSHDWLKGKTVDEDAMEKRACESGYWYNGRKIPPPDPADVMASLLMDATAMDYSGFETWADDYGYNKDSREAEKIYRASLDIGLRLRRLLGDEKMTQLRELLRDL